MSKSEQCLIMVIVTMMLIYTAISINHEMRITRLQAGIDAAIASTVMGME